MVFSQMRLVLVPVPLQHACADTGEPVKQGMFGIFEVFTDTILICTLTAMVILCSGVSRRIWRRCRCGTDNFRIHGNIWQWISVFTAIALCCFAFSTIIGWGLYGARCMEYLSSEKWVKPFMVVYALVAIVGATMDLGMLWSIAETFNGLMAIPNLIALFLLSGTVVKLVKDYFARHHK